MARVPERKFDPTRKLFVRKYFISNGHRYAPGMEFDWQRLSIAQRRVVQMFEAGKLTHKDGDAEPQEEPKEKALNDLADAGQYWEADDKAFEDQGVLAVASVDHLDEIDDMKELRAIADAEGAPYKVSKVDQRQAIREKRAEQ